MPKIRYTVNESGQLEDRDGNVLGRLCGLTLDTSSSVSGADGVAFSSSELQGTTGKTTPLPPDAKVIEVWEHYLATISSRFDLNVARRRDIERALKVRSVEDCKRAITGLSRSPHHNGQNDTGKRYLDIRYALRGNSHRGESIEERIDAMAELADAPPIATQTRSAAEEDRIRVLKAVCGRVASEKRDDVKAAAKELADRWGIIVHFQRDRYGNPEVARFEEAR